MEKIEKMLQDDSCRWDCPEYNGVIFVHPDQVEYTIDYLCVVYSDRVNGLKSSNHSWNKVGLYGGGELLVTHLGPVGLIQDNRLAAHDHAGCRYTSVMLSLDVAGGPSDLRTIPCLLNGKVFKNIEYLMTRMQSKSKYFSKFVMM